jgi:hypothetical protein
MIHAIGSKVYARGRRGHYDLVDADSKRRASGFQRRRKPAKLSTRGKWLKAGEDQAFECAQPQGPTTILGRTDSTLVPKERKISITETPAQSGRPFTPTF